MTEPTRHDRLVNRSGISPAIAERLIRRSLAFGEATSREPGRPPDGVTYGHGKEPKPKPKVAKKR